MDVYMPSLTDEQLELYVDYENEFSVEDRQKIQSLWTSLKIVQMDNNKEKLQLIRNSYNDAIINNKFNLSLFFLYYYCIAKYRHSSQSSTSTNKNYDYIHRSGQYLDCPEHAFYAANEIETNYRIKAKSLKFHEEKFTSTRTRTMWKIKPSDMYRHFCTMASSKFCIADFIIRKSYEHEANTVKYDCKVVLWTDKSKEEKIIVTSKVGIEFDFMMIEDDMVLDDAEIGSNSNMFLTKQFLDQLKIEKIKHTNYCYVDDKHEYRLSLDKVTKANGKTCNELNLEVEKAITDMDIILQIIKNVTV